MLEEFAKEARRYSSWAAGKSEEHMDAATALRRIVSLYAVAVHLPPPSSEVVSTEEEQCIDEDERKTVYRRTSALAFQYYGEVFNPILVPPESPVIGDIADDIADIYSDVASGLKHYDAGNLSAAAWAWSFNFKFHWGKHASSAIRALHCYLAQADVDALTNGA